MGPKLKSKIWADEFIEFGALLITNTDTKEKFNHEYHEGTLKSKE